MEFVQDGGKSRNRGMDKPKQRLTMTFGIKQIRKPTPTSINRAVRIVTVIISVFISWMNTSTLIGKHSQDIINSISALIVGLINGLSPLFGVEVQPNEKVSVNDVSAMDAPSKEPKITTPL